MDRRQFLQSSAAVAAVGLGLPMPSSDAQETPRDNEVFRTGTLHPSGLYYSDNCGGDPDSCRESVNVLIVAPKPAAVLAEYTKFDRGEDKWGVKYFHNKFVVPVDDDSRAIDYYRQLEADKSGEWIPCIVRVPSSDEPDPDASMHCGKHATFQRKCALCRASLVTINVDGVWHNTAVNPEDVAILEGANQR